MEKLYINGQPKPKDTPHCHHCKDGQKFAGVNQIKTDSLSNNYTERICGECLTKYKIPLVVPSLAINTAYGIRVTTDSMKNFTTDLLTMQNIDKHAVKIALDFDEKVKQMEPTEKEHCHGKDHVWIESYPFRTALGIYVIRNCLHCKQGTVMHNGTTYGGHVQKLVSFVATEGIKYEKAMSVPKEVEVTVVVDNLFNEPTAAVADTTNNLFDDEGDQSNAEPTIDWGI